MKYKPFDLGVWLADVDVNGLSDGEADVLAQFDPSSDEGLDRIAKCWSRPRFEEWDETSKASMLAVLSLSKDWNRAQLTPVFAQFAFPGANMDFGRFIEALRREFLN